MTDQQCHEHHVCAYSVLYCGFQYVEKAGLRRGSSDQTHKQSTLNSTPRRELLFQFTLYCKSKGERNQKILVYNHMLLLRILQACPAVHRTHTYYLLLLHPLPLPSSVKGSLINRLIDYSID
jgi:hypothetical protein